MIKTPKTDALFERHSKAYTPTWFDEFRQHAEMLEKQVVSLRLEKARKEAMIAVFMQHMAHMARSGQQEAAQRIVVAADKAAMQMRLEDLVRATVT